MDAKGKFLFWLGFTLVFAIVIAYIVLMILDVQCFTTWVTSVAVIGIAIVGAILMVAVWGTERSV